MVYKTVLAIMSNCLTKHSLIQVCAGKMMTGSKDKKSRHEDMLALGIDLRCEKRRIYPLDS